MTRTSSDHEGSAPPASFRVAVTGDFENLALAVVPWQSLGADVKVVAFPHPFESAQKTVEALRDFDAITLMHERIPLTREILEQLPRLKVIVFSGNRNLTLDDRAAAERGIVVCQTNPRFDAPATGAGGNSPSELTIGLLLACAWQIPAAGSLIRAGGWAFRPGIPLRGKTLGIIGYGRIGRPVGRTALALGMSVLAFNRSLSDEDARADNVTRTDLDTLLQSSDVVSIHLPLNSSTRGMIGQREIALLKENVIFINTARAAIVAEKPFLEALQSRRIAMAGLDVFWQEPLPADHPLRKLTNVVMTPHIGYSTEETMIIRYRAQLDVLAAYRQGNSVGAYTSAKQ